MTGHHLNEGGQSTYSYRIFKYNALLFPNEKTFFFKLDTPLKQVFLCNKLEE